MSVTQATLLGDTFGSKASGTIPIGGIIMWSGSIASIPTGWALCDGTSGTPDLRNKFIVGAHSGTGIGTSPTAGPNIRPILGGIDGNYTPGNVGGEDAHQLTVNEIPSHNHTFDDYQYFQNGQPSPSGLTLKNATNTTLTTYSTSNTGDNRYHENRPPYYALAFIMRTV